MVIAEVRLPYTQTQLAPDNFSEFKSTGGLCEVLSSVFGELKGEVFVEIDILFREDKSDLSFEFNVTDKGLDLVPVVYCEWMLLCLKVISFIGVDILFFLLSMSL